jgi:Zn-finger nucleic acid-binding protein
MKERICPVCKSKMIYGERGTLKYYACVNCNGKWYLEY